MAKKEDNTMEKIVSLAKRRGFVYQGSEIYGGAAGFWDLGHYGQQLARNIKDLWWRRFVTSRDDMYGLDSTTIMPEKVWEQSGHLKDFTDPMVVCAKCKNSFRSDQLDDPKKCPECGGELSSEKTFNLMFPVQLGVTEGSTGYLRGETAQGMFVNFKNFVDTLRPRLPFGIAQTGRAYRNEIAPRDFLFRVREFDLAEFEYFVHEEEWEKWFTYWQKEIREWISEVGIDKGKVHELEVPDEDRAHYSKRTIDFEFDYPFGRKELYGLAYRTDYDLKAHGLDYTDPESGETFVPHVVEPAFGIGRTLLAVLVSAYDEDEQNGEKRVVLRLKPQIAPVKVAVFPLLKNKPELVKKAREVYEPLKKELLHVVWDDHGNVGKRYRRQDEIGTPYCVTVDFDTLEDESVTVRDRDTMKQERVKTSELPKYFSERF